MDLLLSAPNYHDHGWLAGGDPRVAGLALGLQVGMFGKSCSFPPKIIDFIMCVLKNRQFLE